MPEGDTLHNAANRIRPVLLGLVPDELATPHPRFGKDRWPEKLAGRAVTGVDAYGKHLFIRFEGDLLLHSHLRMSGAWGVSRTGIRWRRAPRRAWLVMRARGHDVVQFDGPILELMTTARSRTSPQLNRLGPDILAAGELDESEVLRRLRLDDPSRPFGDALLDQQIVAGLGTVWRAEGCWAAQIDPHRPTGRVSDEEALEVLRNVRPRMQQSALKGMSSRDRACYGRPGQPCRRCNTPIRGGTLGDNNRPTYWCPTCQL